MIILEFHDVAPVPWLEGDRPEGTGQARVELPRLGCGATCEFIAADSGGESKVVLDPPGEAGLTPKLGAVDYERVQPLRGAVDRSGQARRSRTDDQQVGLLAWRELAADPQSAG